MTIGRTSPRWSPLWNAALEEELAMSRLVLQSIKLTARRLIGEQDLAGVASPEQVAEVIQGVTKLIEAGKMSLCLAHSRLTSMSQQVLLEEAGEIRGEANLMESMEMSRLSVFEMLILTDWHIKKYQGHQPHQKPSNDSAHKVETMTVALMEAAGSLRELLERQQWTFRRIFPQPSAFAAHLEAYRDWERKQAALLAKCRRAAFSHSQLEEEYIRLFHPFQQFTPEPESSGRSAVKRGAAVQPALIIPQDRKRIPSSAPKRSSREP